MQEAWASLGFELIKDPGTRKEGLGALEQARELDPSDLVTLLALGLGYRMEGQVEESGRYYKEAFEAWPTSELASESWADYLSWAMELERDDENAGDILNAE